jgi:gliding motility-associated-like protein
VRGDTDGNVIINEVFGGEGPFLFSLNNGDFQQNTIFSNLPAGVYDLLVQDLNECTFEMEFILEDGNELLLDLGEDQMISLGEAADLHAIINIPEAEVAQFTWHQDSTISCDTCFVLELYPQITNTYGATLFDINGCSVSDMVTIFVRKDRDVFVPNVFSPNQDGQNDVFMIFSGKDVLKINSFQVFNRWGEPVFEQFNFLPNNPAHGWNGWYRGRPCNNAVFVWFAEIAFVDGEVLLFKGDVTLIK